MACAIANQHLAFPGQQWLNQGWTHSHLQPPRTNDAMESFWNPRRWSLILPPKLALEKNVWIWCSHHRSTKEVLSKNKARSQKKADLGQKSVLATSSCIWSEVYFLNFPFTRASKFPFVIRLLAWSFLSSEALAMWRGHTRGWKLLNFLTVGKRLDSHQTLVTAFQPASKLWTSNNADVMEGKKWEISVMCKGTYAIKEVAGH